MTLGVERGESAATHSNRLPADASGGMQYKYVSRIHVDENLFQKYQLSIAVTHPWPSDDVQALRMRCGAPLMSFHPRHASTSAPQKLYGGRGIQVVLTSYQGMRQKERQYTSVLCNLHDILSMGETASECVAQVQQKISISSLLPSHSSSKTWH